MTSTLGAETTRDAFLGGRLSILQPARGYRAGIDPVLLAAAAPVSKGQRVLELGCGVGVASLCLAWRTGASVTGLELQPIYAALARENAKANGVNFNVIEGDLEDMPEPLRQQSFDHVIANPPYFDRARGTPASDAGRETALGETTSLQSWIDFGSKRINPKGWITLILKADRFPEAVAGLQRKFGGLLLLPVVAREGRTAELIILRARKGARAAPKLLFPLILHEGQRHTKDGESYTDAAKQVLRDGAGLGSFFGDTPTR